MYGDAGADTLSGGQGADTLYGYAGIDELLGEEGSDTLYGGVGDDTLDGGENEDVFYGGEGDDKLTMRAADTVTGGDGNDVFTTEDWVNADGSLKTDHGFATITDYNAGDKIEVDVLVPSDFIIEVTGTPGDYEIKLVKDQSKIVVARSMVALDLWLQRMSFWNNKIAKLVAVVWDRRTAVPKGDLGSAACFWA